MLLDTYGVSGALLITSGIMLHSVPVAMLLQNPKNKEKALSFSEKQPNGNGTEHKNNLFICSDHLEKTVTNFPVIKENQTWFMKENNTTLNSSLTKENGLSYVVENGINCNEILVDSSFRPMANNPFQSSINTKIDADHKLENEKISGIETNQVLCSEHSTAANKYIKALRTLAIFKNPPFLVIILTLGIYAYTDIFICIIVIDIAKDKGIVHGKEQFFLMIVQFAQITGYACLGWVTDKGYLTSARFHAIGFLCMALSCCGFMFSNSFSTMVVPLVLFGLCVSVYTSGSPSLVYEYVEETHQSMGIATKCMLKAPLCLTIGPILRKYFQFFPIL